MIRAFLLSLRLHVRWFVQALGPEGRRLAPLTPYRLLVLFLLFPLFALLQALHWIGFALDELFFRGYRRVAIEAPLFITGVPRSATTYVHRTLARDVERFTTFRTWEALFAPSITQRRLIQAIAALDRLLGRPLQRLVAALTRRLTRGFAHIHEVGLQSPEEDYLALLPAGGCFVLVLAFPASAGLWRLGRFQELSEAERRILLDFYHACLQKHLYAAGTGRRLLSKNAAFGSWLPSLAQRFPSARFLVCTREPGAALRSQLSAIRDGLAFFGTIAAAEAMADEFQVNLAHVYRQLREQQQVLPETRLAIVDQGQLQRDSRGLIERALRQLGEPVTDALQGVLEEAGRQAAAQPSRHRHAPPSGAGVSAEFERQALRMHEELLNPGREADDPSQ